MVEIICHGIPRSIRTIMEILIKNGARRAEPGEFARRAFGNGRLSAVQIIALAALWDTETEQTTFGGETENSCMELLSGIESAREAVEGFIEFGETHLDGDDDAIGNVFDELIGRAGVFKREAASIEKRGRVMLMGPMNSGKSTLFNLLSGKGRALVSGEPGTTRDGSTCIIEVSGRKVQLCDTAGTDGLGLDRTASEAVIDGLDGTERVIWMSVGGKTPPPGEVRKRAGEIIEIAAKSDLDGRRETADLLNVSSISGEGLEELKTILSRVPGSMSLSGVADRISGSIEESFNFISSGEYGLAAELLSEAEIETRRILSRGENIQLSVERALSGMCVGK